MKADSLPVEKASVYIEQEEENKFRIGSDQLEKIGAQLRGPRRFSVFYSIILPLIVSVGTVVISSLFQYVSWYNSVNLQSATDVVTNAEHAYEKAAAAIGTRQYAMLTFLPSLKDLVRAKTEFQANANAAVETYPKPTGKNRTAEPKATRSFAGPVSLDKFDLDIKQQWFVSYFEQVKFWNENYDHLLTEIDYAIDRPVFREAGKPDEGALVSDRDMGKVDCSRPFNDELERLNLDASSLKVRFAGTHYCFIATSGVLNRQLAAAVSAVLPTFDVSDEALITKYIDALRMKALAFRCHALHRIDYYKAQKEKSILSISSLWIWRSDARKAEAKKHLEDTVSICNGQTRIARATLTN
jgi:hypothetical protein